METLLEFKCWLHAGAELMQQHHFSTVIVEVQRVKKASQRTSGLVSAQPRPDIWVSIKVRYGM